MGSQLKLSLDECLEVEGVSRDRQLRAYTFSSSSLVEEQPEAEAAHSARSKSVQHAVVLLTMHLYVRTSLLLISDPPFNLTHFS